MDRKIFLDCLRGAPSGVASGPGGRTNEMLRVCLDDQETVSLLFEAAEDFARGQVPPVVCRSLMLATMTALQKRDGGVRGIATGTSFRRLVAKTRRSGSSLRPIAVCPGRPGQGLIVSATLQLS